MTTQTLTLTDFLLARIAVDEISAINWCRFEVRDGIPGRYAIPDRILAECKSKRTIMAEHFPIDPCDTHDGNFHTIPCDTLRALASIYADHPDYRDEWAS